MLPVLRIASPGLFPRSPSLGDLDDLLAPLMGVRRVGGAVRWTEDGDLWRLELDMPGHSRESLDVSVEPGFVTIRGERRRRGEEGGAKFERAFSLPEGVDIDGVAASYEDGVLTLTLPKAAVAKPRKIRIS